MNIAIIGAGFSGLVCATLLEQHYGDALSLTLFEKSRGVGGRMATRYSKDYYFDHGTQFFYVKTSQFDQFLTPLKDAGVIMPWKGRFREYQDTQCTLEREWGDAPTHYVGVPHMNAIGKYLAKGLTIQKNTRITSITKQDDLWQLYSESAHAGKFDWVIVTTPTPQTLTLIPPTLPCYNELQSKQMLACFSLMIGFDRHYDFGFESMLVTRKDISWISVNSSKPGREHTSTTLLVHSTNAYAEVHIDSDKHTILKHLLKETERIIGADVYNYAHIDIHGWKYANAPKQTGAQHYLDSKERIGICGDSLIQGRVESAFTSSSGLVNEFITKESYESI